MRSYEKGTSWSADSSVPYIVAYDQPAYDMLVAWLYHFVWEKLTSKIWFKLERFQDNRAWDYRPFTCRQDERCYYLTNKNRTNVGTLHEVLNENGRTQIDHNVSHDDEH